VDYNFCGGEAKWWHKIKVSKKYKYLKFKQIFVMVFILYFAFLHMLLKCNLSTFHIEV
jgi:hypothetical protein